MTIKTRKSTPNHSADLIDQLLPDRNVSEPVYQQLLRRLTALIDSGVIKDGQSLPSERLLAEKLGLSRTTVRHCYEELKAKHYLSAHGRAGAMALAPPALSPRMGKLKGFTEEMQELGMEASSQLLERSVLRDRTIASVFNRPSTAQFIRLVRLRLGDGVPLSREVAWYDLASAPELEHWDAKGSAYAYLGDRCGIALNNATQTIEAVMSSEVESKAFGFAQSQPCLLIKRKTLSISGQLIEYVEGTFRGDAYAYRVDLLIN